MESARPCREHTPEALITYLYDECDPEERARMEAHLASCHSCAAELESLRGVRGTLGTWGAPDAVPGFRVVSDTEHRADTGGEWSSWRTQSWGLAAAAVVVLVVAAAVASVEIRYDAEGFAFRMGWVDRPAIGAGSEVPPQEATAAQSDPTSAEPWVDDLATLENQLRGEMLRQVADLEGGRDTPPPQTGLQPTDPAVLLERVEGLITASERRQQQELALWFTQFAQEQDMQRRADQQRVQEEIGALEGMTDYLVRVSSRP